MKSVYLSVVILLVGSTAFSQVAQKKQMQKSTPGTLLTAKVVDTTSVQKNVIKTSPINHTPLENTAVPKNSVETKLTAKNENIASVGSSNMQFGNGLASLFDIFITIETGINGGGLLMTSSGDNKDPDTHWSCGVFDQNEKQIGSFHDDSDNDEYPMDATTGPLKMHLDNSAILNNFVNGGHLHINIAPNGNDTWGISKFTLTFDFLNPKCSQVVSWTYINLSQDHRDVDLYFTYDGKTFAARQ